jgi:NADPH-dependent 7-cyano-7-deazaguanine reductase QueF
MPESVECDLDVRCRLVATVAPQCPVINERDCYEVTVEWTPNGETFEKHGLVSFLEHFDDSELTQEELAAHIYGDLNSHDVSGLVVRVQDTVHVDMEVTKR